MSISHNCRLFFLWKYTTQTPELVQINSELGIRSEVKLL